MRTIETALDAAAGRLPVCVGATHAATDRCIAFSRQAETAGAAALSVGPPALMRVNEAALQRRYEAVADATGLPVVVQDFPPLTRVQMAPRFLADLAAAVPSCRWLKLEHDPTAPKTSAVLVANPDLRVFGGLGGMFMLEELQRGAIGTMTGLGFPEVLVAVYRLFAAGHVDAAREIFFRNPPLIRFENRRASICRCGSRSTSSGVPSRPGAPEHRTRPSMSTRSQSSTRSSATCDWIRQASWRSIHRRPGGGRRLDPM